MEHQGLFCFEPYKFTLATTSTSTVASGNSGGGSIAPLLMLFGFTAAWLMFPKRKGKEEEERYEVQPLPPAPPRIYDPVTIQVMNLVFGPPILPPEMLKRPDTPDSMPSFEEMISVKRKCYSVDDIRGLGLITDRRLDEVFSRELEIRRRSYGSDISEAESEDSFPFIEEEVSDTLSDRPEYRVNRPDTPMPFINDDEESEEQSVTPVSWDIVGSMEER